MRAARNNHLIGAAAQSSGHPDVFADGLAQRTISGGIAIVETLEPPRLPLPPKIRGHSANGNWSSDIIFQSPDGYAAGDGPKGTGFSPQLRYDQSGRAHILFLDHAGEHFSNIGQQEYAGNLRHAWFNGSSWSVETVARQTNPLQQQIVFPTFAMSGNEMAVTYMERNTQWNLSSFPPLANSQYYFRFLTKPLP